MLNTISKIINSNPIGRIFGLQKKQVVWKRVKELKAGDEIAVAPDHLRGGVAPAAHLGGVKEVEFVTPSRWNEVKWDKIQSIECVGRERVYDIEVEKTHNFVGNGIIAHNTYISANVGIGTTGPTQQLDVVGNINVSGTGIMQDVDINGKLLAASNLPGSAGMVLTSTGTGVSWGTVSSGGGTITGSGTTNYLAKWSSGTGLTSSLLLDNGTNVGIGTSTLGTAKFSVMGGNVGIGTTSPLSLFQVGTVGAGQTGSFIQINSTGNVGIGTTSPGYKLEVGGNTTITGGDLRLNSNRILNSAGDATIMFSSTPSTSWNTLDAGGWKVLNGANLGQAALAVDQLMGGDIFTASASGSPRFVINNAGNVGIGTTNPNYSRLDVNAGGTSLIGFYNIGSVGNFSATSSVQYGIVSAPKQNVTTSGSLIGLYSRIDTEASAITLAGAFSLYAANPSKGAGSTITAAYGLYVENITAGTTNYSLYVAGGTSYFGGNVGIGTTNPGTILEVNQSGTASSDYTYRFLQSGLTSGNYNTIALGKAAAGGQAGLIVYQYDATTPLMIFNHAGDSNSLVIKKGGNVGIGTTGPGTKLALTVTGASSDGIGVTHDGTGGSVFLGSRGTGYGGYLDMFQGSPGTGHILLRTYGVAYFNNAQVAIGTETPGAAGKLYIQGDTNDSSAAGLNVTNSSDTSLLYVRNDGNVGIGTTSPTLKLDVRDDGTGAVWHRMGLTNSSSDRAVFLGTYNGNTGVFAHNFALSAWNPLYINTTNGSSDGGNVIIAGSGYVGIGDATPSYQLELSTNSAAKPTSDHWTVPSDSRLKTDIVAIPNALETIMKLKGREFEYIDKEKFGVSRQYGFIAQDVETVIPRWVQTGADGFKTLTIAGDTALLVEAIKEQQTQIARLDSTQVSSEARLASLSAQLGQFNLTDTGDLVLDTRENTYNGVIAEADGSFSETYLSYISNLSSLKNSAGETITRVGAFAEIVSAKIKAGFIQTTDLLAENIRANQLSISGNLSAEKIVSPVVETGNLLLKDYTGATVANIDSEGNAEFSGNVGIGEDLLVAGDATVSGELTVNELVADSARIKKLRAESIEGLEAYIASFSAQNIKTENISGLEASPSADLNILSDLSASASAWPITVTSNDVKLEGNITILGTTSLAQTIVSGPITQDGTFLIDEGNSLNVLGGTLYIQNKGTGGIDLLAGKVTIDTLGNAVFEGNLTVKDTLFAGLIRPSSSSGEIVFDLSPLSDLGNLGAGGSGVDSVGFGKLLAKGVNGETVYSLDASGSAEFKGHVKAQALNVASDLAAASFKVVRDAVAAEPDLDGIIVSTASAGLAKIPANKSEVTIKSPFVTDKSLIYLTPIGSTENQVLYLARTKPEEQTFTVGIDGLPTKDILFNWWIVN